MPRPKTQRETLTIGQLAKIWGIGRDHAQRLVDAGAIPEVFRIPAAGRYGEAVRIPLASVLLVQQEWATSSNRKQASERRERCRQNGHSPKLKHFPELHCETEDDAECPGDDQH
jgi:hypothetical protein